MPKDTSPSNILTENSPGEPEAAPHEGVSRRSFLGRVALAGAALAAPTAALAEPSDSHAGAETLPAPSAKSAPPVAASARIPVTLNINKQPMRLDLEPRTTLLDALREDAHLTGSKKGCNHGQCGACTVLINGKRALSCLTLALTVQGDQITTIEGLAQGDDLHPVQAAFLENDAFQCGYCTPGQICSAVAMMGEIASGDPSYVTPDVKTKISLETVSDMEIRERMSGNICRCGAYPNIVAACKQVAQTGKGGSV